MNFIFMIILILIILLFFNIYLKQIKSSFYTTIVLFVLIVNELYFSKMENFQGHINDKLIGDKIVGIPSFPDYRLGYDFKQHMNKQMCLFDEQENIIKTNAPINTKCHKISNRTSCDMYIECEYDTEFNRCNEKSNCNNIDTEPLDCHYMDNQDTCHTLSKKMPKCDIYDNKKECNKNEGLCKWDSKNKKCDYLEDTCIKSDKDECNKNSSNCEWKYYSDIYNAEPNSETNIIQCHSLKKLDMSRTELPNPNHNFENLDDLNKTLNDIFENSEYDDIDYYGIYKTNLGTYYLYLLTISNLDTISKSVVSKHKCLNNNTYLGNEDYIMIYKRNGECKTIQKCNWETNVNPSHDVCHLQDTQKCLEDSKCFYDYKSNECKPKGFCKDAKKATTPTKATTKATAKATTKATKKEEPVKSRNWNLAYDYMVDHSQTT
jgi:hypothetical protein